VWGLYPTEGSNPSLSATFLYYRVGNGVIPVTSHTTGHTVPYHGGSVH
jgi:hypothetical protein